MTDHSKSDVSKLKPDPCPLCGEEADACIRGDYDDDAFATTYCTGCGAQISYPVFDFEPSETVLENCILAWNRRTEAAP